TINCVVALVACAALYLYFRLTASGRAVRAVVDDPILLDVTGLDPARVRRRAWVIGSLFASLSGVLIAPYLGLDAVLLTLLVVRAFGAALAYPVVFLSLSLLVRLSGQVSLCQTGFMAVGAAVFSHLVHSHGVPWLLGVLLAGLLTIPCGAVIAIPAIRLSGLYL